MFQNKRTEDLDLATKILLLFDVSQLLHFVNRIGTYSLQNIFSIILHGTTQKTGSPVSPYTKTVLLILFGILVTGVTELIPDTELIESLLDNDALNLFLLQSFLIFPKKDIQVGTGKNHRCFVFEKKSLSMQKDVTSQVVILKSLIDLIKAQDNRLSQILKLYISNYSSRQKLEILQQSQLLGKLTLEIQKLIFPEERNFIGISRGEKCKNYVRSMKFIRDILLKKNQWMVYKHQLSKCTVGEHSGQIERVSFVYFRAVEKMIINNYEVDILPGYFDKSI